jgi:hypothetical protein
VFWVYLYGAGGIYWDIYDRLRPLVDKIEPARIRSILHSFHVREGLIYTFLDNLLAPRVYYLRNQFLKLLPAEDSIEWRHARGTSEIDDTEIVLGKIYGPQIYGPDGEIRLVVTRPA